jgi:hypothetical protein
MALAGDEKRIQALFSETALQDRSAAPTFEELWASAAMKTSASPRSLSRPLLVVAAALLVAAVSSGAWYWSTRSSQQQAVNVAPQTVSPPALQQVAQQTNRIPADILVKSRPGRPNKRRLRQSDRPAIAEAALLSRWQSPTRIFMDSPATVDFNSLPQLNQSAEKLKQFLPRNTELTKESNQ